MGEKRPRDQRRENSTASAWRVERGRGQHPGEGGWGCQRPVPGEWGQVGAACGQAGTEVGEGTHVWGTGPSCYGDTPLDNLFQQPLGTDPVGAPLLMGAEEAKVTLVLGPSMAFPLLCGLQALQTNRGLGRKSRKE